jgi:hypothetical protein
MSDKHRRHGNKFKRSDVNSASKFPIQDILNTITDDLELTPSNNEGAQVILTVAKDNTMTTTNTTTPETVEATPAKTGFFSRIINNVRASLANPASVAVDYSRKVADRTAAQLAASQANIVRRQNRIATSPFLATIHNWMERSYVFMVRPMAWLSKEDRIDAMPLRLVKLAYITTLTAGFIGVDTAINVSTWTLAALVEPGVTATIVGGLIFSWGVVSALNVGLTVASAVTFGVLWLSLIIGITYLVSTALTGLSYGMSYLIPAEANNQQDVAPAM